MNKKGKWTSSDGGAYSKFGDGATSYESAVDRAREEMYLERRTNRPPCERFIPSTGHDWCVDCGHPLDKHKDAYISIRRRSND